MRAKTEPNMTPKTLLHFQDFAACELRVDEKSPAPQTEQWTESTRLRI